jgi:tRNA1Val (adenine37-N6)-methyltransferase
MSVFRFRHFEVRQESSAMKIGTDAMVLGALATANHPQSILDIGTGTGVLTLMMAQKFPNATLHAIEIDSAATDEARLNVEKSPWADRIHVWQSDFRDFESREKYALIISNPPYFTNGLVNPDRSKARARHESALPFEVLFTRVSECLKEDDGLFWMIAPSAELEALNVHAERANLWMNTRIDIQGKEGGAVVRNVLCFAFNRSENTVHEQLTIRTANGHYTQEYKALTIDFHGVRI